MRIPPKKPHLDTAKVLESRQNVPDSDFPLSPSTPTAYQRRYSPSRLKNFYHTCRFSVILAVVFSTAICLNIQQLLVLPLHFTRYTLPLYRKITSFLGRLYVPVMVLLFEVCSHTQVLFYNEDFFRTPVASSGILISNHISFADWPVWFFITFRKGVEGYLRILMKEIVKVIPGLGWGTWFNEFFFIKKSWTADGPRLMSGFSSFRKSGSNIWVGLFPEGTFVDADSMHLIPESHQFSKKRGIDPPFKRVLFPRVKGFNSAIQVLRGHVSQIIDCTIVFSGNVDPSGPQFNSYTTLDDPSRVLPTLSDMVNGLAPARIHVHAKSYKVSELPQDSEALEKWLIARFREKEERLEFFAENGCFPEGNGFKVSYSRLWMSLCLLYWAVWLGFGVYGILQLSSTVILFITVPFVSVFFFFAAVQAIAQAT